MDARGVVGSGRCPGCGQGLEAPSGDLPASGCAECGGWFLDGAATEKLVVEELGISQEILSALPEHGIAQDRACAGCDAALHTCPLRGVKVDLCPRCGGLWLDRGELRRLTGGRRDAESTQGLKPRYAKKFDFDSPLEVFFTGGAFICGGMALVAALSYLTGNPTLVLPFIAIDDVDVKWLAVPGIIGAVVLGLVRSQISVSYLFHPESAKVLCIRHIFGSRSTHPIIAFDDVAVVTVVGYFVRGDKHTSSHFRYRASLVTRAGKHIPISDWHPRALPVVDAVAEDAARMIGARFVPGLVGGTARVRRAGGEVSVEQRPITFLQRHWWSIVTSVVGVIAVLTFGRWSGRLLEFLSALSP